MGRSNKNKNLPIYMTEARGCYLTRYPIPEEFRPAFPQLAKRKQLITNILVGDARSSGKPTSDDLEKHSKNIKAIEAVMAEWRLKSPPSSAATHRVSALYTPDQILSAIERWRDNRVFSNQKFGQDRELKELHGVETPLEDFNGRDLLSHRLDAISDMSRRIMKEDGGRAKGRHFIGFNAACFPARGEFDAYGAVPDFHDKLALALNGEGIHLRSDAPILGKAFAVEAFAGAWSSVLKSELHWLCGSQIHSENEWALQDLSTKQESGEQLNSAKTDGTDAEAAKQIDTLSKLFSHYEKTELDIKNIDKKRQWWGLLIRNFGDVSPSDITVFKMKAFRTSLRKAPKTRIPSVEALTLDEQISKIEDLIDAGKLVKTRSEKTIYDYFGFYHTVFGLAKADGIINKNPVEGVKPAKPKKGFKSRKIKPYSDDDIKEIFSTPLFMGCDKIRSKTNKSVLHGYRNRAGDLIEKDGRYFMPLLGLLSGARMEEWGGARVRDIKCHNGIWFLDLTQRLLKTESSKRLVPLHPRLTDPLDLNFLGYLNDRKKNGDEFLFPEFKPVGISDAQMETYLEKLRKSADGEDPLDEADVEVLKMTATYSKWFGLWCDKHGFKDPDKNYHSFRHTFKNRIRGKAAEDVHDSITGHANSNHVGRDYADDCGSFLIELPEYYNAVCKVHYPTLPKFP